MVNMVVLPRSLFQQVLAAHGRACIWQTASSCKLGQSQLAAGSHLAPGYILPRETCLGLMVSLNHNPYGTLPLAVLYSTAQCILAKSLLGPEMEFAFFPCPILFPPISCHRQVPQTVSYFFFFNAYLRPFLISSGDVFLLSQDGGSRF